MQLNSPFFLLRVKNIKMILMIIEKIMFVFALLFYSKNLLLANNSKYLHQITQMQYWK